MLHQSVLTLYLVYQSVLTLYLVLYQLILTLYLVYQSVLTLYLVLYQLILTLYLVLYQSVLTLYLVLYQLILTLYLVLYQSVLTLYLLGLISVNINPLLGLISVSINPLLGLMSVSIKLFTYCFRFKQDNDDYNVIMVKAIADRLAEAFAEQLHEKVRKDLWGYVNEEQMEAADLHKIRYQVETYMITGRISWSGLVWAEPLSCHFNGVFHIHVIYV